ncbi:MAG: galactose ABC transporter substrate-binding protein [Ruminococcaceae bacterium]|nr:galactose ABC transporter substrate-binding protein [Oscillospiraceae bacterium]
MKHLTRLFIFLLIVALLIPSATACGNKKSADVHVFYYTYSDTYISTVRSALDKALSNAGISYQDHDSNNNQTTQTEQVQTAITKGAKLLVVNIVTTGSDDAASGIVALAKDAGIPVIFFNREVSDSVVKSYDKCAFIGTDATESGKLQGDMIGDYVVKNFDKVDLNRDGQISYVLFMGEKGNNEAIYRTRYSVENANKKLKAAGKKELKFYDPSNPDKYLLDRDGKWSAQAANEYMTTLLSSHSTANKNMVELIICNNDGMAEGAISALNGAGYNTGKSGSVTIPVFGVDATSAAKELIRAGKMAGTIKQDAEGMAQAILKSVNNGVNGKALFDGMTDYNIDENVAKLRIPYAVYLGEE